jgi:glycosyltransferase involved in cell wall biosynthesis
MIAKTILHYLNLKTYWRAAKKINPWRRRNIQRKVEASLAYRYCPETSSFLPADESACVEATEKYRIRNSVSICIATRNHAPYLQRTLESIFQQLPIPNTSVEVIVVDDGSNDETPEVLDRYPVRHLRLENSSYGNGGLAKNIGLRAASGDIVIQQSDDVLHATPNLIRELTSDFPPGEFRIVTVYDFDSQTGNISHQYAGREYPRPLFFLGAVRREDICKVGGYDPEFDGTIWFNDDWHGDGLVHGLGLRCIYLPLLGLHQSHPRPKYDKTSAKKIYRGKCKRAQAGDDPQLWLSSAGSWPYVPGVSVEELEGNILVPKVA